MLFDAMVAIVAGAGGGLRRAFSNELARRGGKLFAALCETLAGLMTAIEVKAGSC
jgi:NAD(P)-dependent dehydrogenase (short-subunit alcohol dehydrogenase family)